MGKKIDCIKNAVQVEISYIKWLDTSILMTRLVMTEMPEGNIVLMRHGNVSQNVTLIICHCNVGFVNIVTNCTEHLGDFPEMKYWRGPDQKAPNILLFV